MMFATLKERLGDVDAVLKCDSNDLTTDTSGSTIDVNTVDTREPQRDAHLKAPDFFDAEKYPTIKFRSTQVTRNGENAYKVTGHLTIRDVTRPVTLDVEFTGQGKDPWGNQRIGLTA